MRKEPGRVSVSADGSFEITGFTGPETAEIISRLLSRHNESDKPLVPNLWQSWSKSPGAISCPECGRIVMPRASGELPFHARPDDMTRACRAGLPLRAADKSAADKTTAGKPAADSTEKSDK
jgi:hypothetical protein